MITREREIFNFINNQWSGAEDTLGNWFCEFLDCMDCSIKNISGGDCSDVLDFWEIFNNYHASVEIAI